MAPYVMLVQIIVSIAVIILVLVQSRGEGFNASFSSDTSIFRSRRGVELRLFQLTIGVAVLFVAISILAVIAVRTSG